MRRRLRGVWLGRRRYEPLYRLQRTLHEQRRANAVGDTVLLLEHTPVITFGRGGHWEHLLTPREHLAERGIELLEVDRGGDITLHAPGQLVCYPILNLNPDRQDVRRYVGDLTETMRRLAAGYGVAAGPAADLVGLWTDGARPDAWTGPEQATQLAKLGAIGVRLSRWVSMHGFAFNLTTDLDLFSLIVPCGIAAHPVTSIQALTGRSPSVRDAAAIAFRALADVFDADADALEDATGRQLDQVAADQMG